MAVATLVATAACSTRRQAATTPGAAAEQTVEMQPATSQPHVIGLPPVQAMPQATVFRMSGDYADNVPVDIYPQGRLFSYPAPADVTPASAPVPLAGGWWLDRRGVGDHGSDASRHDTRRSPGRHCGRKRRHRGCRATSLNHRQGYTQ